MQDWISGKNVILQYGMEKMSLDEFCNTLEVLLFYSPHQCPSSPSLLNFLMLRYLRRRLRWQSVIKMSWREILIAKQTCRVEATNSRDQIYAFAWLVEEKDSRLVDYSSEENEVYRKVAMPLRLLNLSLVDERQLFSERSTPSWAPEWHLQRRIFLFNHPSSNFQASAVQVDSSLFNGKFMQFRGITVDSVKATSEYLPWRRHCDHYQVEGFNAIVFSEWFEFAQHERRRICLTKDDQAELLVDFADTIQARGCNSIWEPDQSPNTEDLIDKTRKFLAFLEMEDMAVTSDLRLFYAACFPSHGRRFGVTRRGYFCLVPEGTTPGDLVCIPHGGRVPVILRSSNKSHLNVGECYVKSYMQSDAVTRLGSCKEELFTVV